MTLRDKIVFITGASSGIGKACARAFAQAGAHIIMCARRQEKLHQLSQECQQQYKVKTLTLPLDVCDLNAVNQAINSLDKEWKNIDILINSAGLAAGLATIQEGDVNDWQRMIDTNISGLLYVSRAILPLMIESAQGHIINIGSIAGHEVYPNGTVYCATKHAVNAITRGMKMDLANTPIRITTIDPGMVKTEFSMVRFAGDKNRAERVYENMTPLQAEDIADAAVYAASRPKHVNISEMIILATDQGSATLVNRHKT